MSEKHDPTTTDELFQICVQLVAEAQILHVSMAAQIDELRRVTAELRASTK